jgi:hypothetical protein
MLSSRELRIQEFYAERRSKRPKFQKCDPESELSYIRNEKEYRENYLVDPVKERLMKAAIDYFIIQLRTRKIVPDYHRNNREIVFFYYGYCRVKFCYSGYITIWPSGNGVDKVEFIVTDGRDIVEKMIRFGVLRFEDFK